MTWPGGVRAHSFPESHSNPSKVQREDLMRLFALNWISFFVTPPLLTSNVDVMNQWSGVCEMGRAWGCRERVWWNARQRAESVAVWVQVSFVMTSRRRFEIIITQQYSKPQGCSVCRFSRTMLMSSGPTPVIAWLMYTRDTKRELHYSVGTAPNVNIIDKSGRKRLEISLHEVIFVKLCQYFGIGFEPSAHCISKTWDFVSC
jgi:hypothetical protein